MTTVLILIYKQYLGLLKYFNDIESIKNIFGDFNIHLKTITNLKRVRF